MKTVWTSPLCVTMSYVLPRKEVWSSKNLTRRSDQSRVEKASSRGVVGGFEFIPKSVLLV